MIKVLGSLIVIFAGIGFGFHKAAKEQRRLEQGIAIKLMESYYEHPRQILCFFYYPSDEYLTYLMTVDEMMFTDEIDCSDLFGGNSERERIMIFEIGQ